MPTIGDMVTSALTEIRVARAGDVLAPDDMATGLYVFNRLLDLWNADYRKVYASGFTDYTFTPSLSPHTIGPGGTFTATVRPVELLYAAVNIGGSPASFIPIDVQDAAWYATMPVPALTSTIPTDVYYQPDSPLGKLYFWGIPTVAYGVRLWTRSLLASVVQTDTFSLPQGYQAALELTLAEELAASFGQQVSSSTERRAREARALIFGNNDDAPYLRTRDAGLAGGEMDGSGFNWLTRTSS
jgi:hypothetical protein